MLNIKNTGKLRRGDLLVVSGLILIVLAFMGCETLEFSNPNSPDLTGATLQTLITGADSNMRQGLIRYLQVTEIIGRNTYFIEPSDPRFTSELLYGPIDAGGFLNNTPWIRRYQVVFNCNAIFERAENLSGTEKAGVEAFAKTLRAYQLLLMLNYLDTEGVRLNFDGDLTVAFASKEQSFDFIENDLDQAMTALNSAGDEFSFTLSDGFAGFDTPANFAKFNRAIAARVSVYRGKFNDALADLNASFLNEVGDLNSGVYHVYSSAPGDLLNPIYEVPTAAVINYYAHQSFETDAQVNDLGVVDSRFTSKAIKRTAFFNDDLTSDLGVTVAKSITDPWPIIRNEELILLRAEANIGLGLYADAQTDMNIVRTEAGLEPYTDTDVGNALDRLMYEKRYSLFGEGHRWIDMRRYGKLGELPIDRPDRGDFVITHMVPPEDEVAEQ